MNVNQMQQNTQVWARHQINQLMQFFPGVTYHDNQQGIDQYRCPLMLSISKTPLYIRIDLPPTFPV